VDAEAAREVGAGGSMSAPTVVPDVQYENRTGDDFASANIALDEFQSQNATESGSCPVGRNRVVYAIEKAVAALKPCLEAIQRGEKARTRAVEIINRFQQDAGQGKDALTRLAKAIGVNVATLYRWKSEENHAKVKVKTGAKKETIVHQYKKLEKRFGELSNSYKELKEQKDVTLSFEENRLLGALLYGRIADGLVPKLLDRGITEDEMRAFRKVAKALVPNELAAKLRNRFGVVAPPVELLLPEFAESHKAQALLQQLMVGAA
jgi:hypothetical protein